MDLWIELEQHSIVKIIPLSLDQMTEMYCTGLRKSNQIPKGPASNKTFYLSDLWLVDPSSSLDIHWHGLTYPRLDLWHHASLQSFSVTLFVWSSASQTVWRTSLLLKRLHCDNTNCYYKLWKNIQFLIFPKLVKNKQVWGGVENTHIIYLLFIFCLVLHEVDKNIGRYNIFVTFCLQS